MVDAAPLFVDWNARNEDGTYTALTDRFLRLGDYVVCDDREGVAFLCIVTSTGGDIVTVRQTDRIHR